MKKCFKCLEEKPLDEFYPHPKMADGRLNKCKRCTRKDVSGRYAATRKERAAYDRERNRTEDRKRQRSESQKRYAERNPDKKKARSMVGNAIRDGRLERKPCCLCGAEKSQAHHHDYSKPLDVRWLCFKCHREEEHGQTVANN